MIKSTVSYYIQYTCIYVLYACCALILCSHVFATQEAKPEALFSIKTRETLITIKFNAKEDSQNSEDEETEETEQNLTTYIASFDCTLLPTTGTFFTTDLEAKSESGDYGCTASIKVCTIYVCYDACGLYALYHRYFV